MVGIVVVVALVLRWGFVATGEVVSPLRVDAGQYAQYAHNLVEHGTYSLATSVPPPPDSYRSPGYPFVLALCRLVASDGWHSLVLALQVALGTATVWLTYGLARRWLSFPAAAVAAAACALSPHLVASCTYVLTECTTTFALVAGLTLVASAPSRWRLAASGACLGFTALCNETFVFVPIVIAWPLARAHGLRRAALCAAIALLPWACWSIRNGTQDLARRGSERVTASVSHGTYPGMVFRDPRLRGFPYREDPEQPAFGASWHDIGRVLGPRFAERPWRHVAWYLFEKPVWLWGWKIVQGTDVLVYEVANNPYDSQPIAIATHRVMRWLHAPMMFFAAVAMAVFAWNPRRRHSWIAQAAAFVVATATAAHLLVIPDPRYLQPVRPVLFVLAAAGATAAFERIRDRRAIGARSEAVLAAER